MGKEQLTEAMVQIQADMQQLTNTMISRLDRMEGSMCGLRSDIAGVRKELSDLKKDMSERVAATEKTCDELRELIKDAKAGAKAEALSELDENLASFKSQMVSHQVNSKKEESLLKKKMEKVEAQLNGTNNTLESLGKKIEELELGNMSSARGEWGKKMETNLKELSGDNKNLKEKIIKLEEAASLREEKFERDIEVLKTNASTVVSQNLMSIPNEFQLREQKRNNLIIFGIHEKENQDKSKIEDLLHDLNVCHNPLQVSHLFRVGRSTNQCRPVILKLPSAVLKNEILAKARNLKGNDKWKGVVLTHDLTKMQYAEEKAREMHLRNDADKKNLQLSNEDKLTKLWKVVGGRGSRHVAVKPLN